MPYLHIAIVLLLSLHTPARSAMTTDTISAGQALSVGDKLVSKNGRYALGFFEVDSNWYLGIWFNSVSKFTQAWVANRDDPIKNPTSLQIIISHDDANLVIINRSTDSIIWSAQNKTPRKNTTALLLNSGNFILRNASNSSDILWQSFDYPTDTFFPGAKLGWDKITGLNRRLVSRKNSISPATGFYRCELDPSGVDQTVLTPLSSSQPYWTSGAWNGKYFSSIPEMSRNDVNKSFVDNAKEKYYTYETVEQETLVIHHYLDVSGQSKSTVWMEGSQDWVTIYAQPKAQCDVYAACGPFTVCNDEALPHCTCMQGFNIRSPKDWMLDDRTGGCLRNTPVDCIANGSTSSSTDKFYSMSCVGLPQTAQKIEAAKSDSECAQVCLDNCSCTAYSFSSSRCSIWHNELLNVRQLQCGEAPNSNGETIYLRLASKDMPSFQKHRRRLVIVAATGTSVAALGLFAFILLLLIWRNEIKNSSHIPNSAQYSDGIVAFRYTDLQRATENFSEKLGGGGFGSVFKGLLNGLIPIAVKRLDYAHQGEKQFRAEVSSIGIIQHINLVKLIGFCCEDAKRLLVYEHMPNGSLDIHLFQSHTTVLKWSTRYQIALGVARGLAYLHEKCRDCIIHCDIKPENILLSESYIPKIADFGMAKFLGRDFSRVITTMRGTIGYLAPEWISGVAITPKVDVYAYGMVLLEIVSGKRNSCVSCSCGTNKHDVYYPLHVAREILNGGDVMSLLDNTLCGDVNLKEAEIACKLACWCIQDDDFDRPTMGEVVQILEGLLEIDIPPMPKLLQNIAGSSNYSTCC